MIIQSYTLSLQPGGFPVRVPCVQWDNNSRDITFHLVSGGTSFYPPDGAVVTIDGTKSDGKSFSVAGAFSSSDVTVSLTQQMTAVAGDVPCQLTITSDTAVLGTARFILAVSEAAIPTDPDLSSSDMSAFESLKNAAAQSASAAAEQATAAANSATAAANSATEAAAAVSGKADLAVPAAVGNLAKLTAQGNLADAGLAVSMGAWTPVVTGATSYTSQAGTYLKIGNLVLLQFYVYGTFGGSATEKFSVTGCPFAPATGSGGGGILSGYTSAANIIPTGWRIDREGGIWATGQATGTDGAKYNTDAIYQRASGDFMVAGTIAFGVN
jgi:hypothetical protein